MDRGRRARKGSCGKDREKEDKNEDQEKQGMKRKKEDRAQWNLRNDYRGNKKDDSEEDSDWSFEKYRIVN